MWQSLIRLIESGVAGPPNKLFMGFFVGGSQKRHHDLYLLEMQNAKKSMAIKKKIALMSRLGVVRANAAHTMPEPSESPAALAIYYQVLWSLKLCSVCLFVCYVCLFLFFVCPKNKVTLICVKSNVSPDNFQS